MGDLVASAYVSMLNSPLHNNDLVSFLEPEVRPPTDSENPPTMMNSQVNLLETPPTNTKRSTRRKTKSIQQEIKHMVFRQHVLPSLTTQNSPRMSPLNEHRVGTTSVSKLPMLQPYTMSNSAAKFFKVNRFAGLTVNNDEIDQADILKEKQLIKNLEDSQELQFADREAPDLIGEHAPKAYYLHYKHIDKIQQQNQFASLKPSIQTSMLTESDLQNVIPCKLGLIKTKGEDTIIKIQNRRYGDKYASVLSEGLKGYAAVKDFKLKNNRIHQHGASVLLNTIGKNARTIDLQQNSIGRLGIDSICASLISKESKIEVLNVEDNHLGTNNVLKLLDGLRKNQTIKSLNVSKNFITNEVGDAFKQFLIGNDHLEELYLCWNQIKGSGGLLIFDGLIANENLLVLDFSWNSLGMDSPACINRICEYIKKNRSLLHLDLSSNFFARDSCKQIAENLKFNRSIYGFHFTGNYGYVDARGFLIVDDNSPNNSQLMGVTRINGLSQTQFSGIGSANPIIMKDSCWICQGWQEHEFKCKSEAELEPLFVHLQFENYNAVYIMKKKNDIMSLNLMVPPLITRYFFTAIDEQTVDPVSPQIELQHQLTQKVRLIDREVEVTLERLNVTSKPKRFDVIEQSSYQPAVSILPRTPDPIYIPPKLKNAKRVWSFPISIWFKDFRFETEEVLRKCFEKDWACAKISKVAKNPDEFNALKELLWKNYRQIKETYKNYASYNPNGDVWSISSNPITEFCQTSELIDNKTLKLSDLDLKFIATCSASIEYKGNFRNPERALCRFQFMEFLVRLSEDKYLKSKLVNNIVEATEAMINQCRPVMSQFDAQKWRNERYFNEQCDDVCKHFRPMVNNVYSRFSTKKVKPGQKNFMCLDELHDICNLAGFFDENFVDRDANMAFNLSKLTEVDELERDNIFQMSFVEFLEAIARVAEKISPIGLDANRDVDWNYENRFAQPLHVKLEKIMTILASTCASEEYKNTFGKISKSMFTKEATEDDS